MDIGEHSRQESAAIDVYPLADAMTAEFFVFLFSLLLFVLGTASSGRKGQWQAGLEEVTALTGLKYLG